MKLNKKDEARLHGYQSDSRSDTIYTEAFMIDCLQRAAQEHAGQLTRSMYQSFYDSETGVPHPFTVIRRYGRWNLGLEAAGLPTNKRSHYRSSHSEADCISALQECRRRLGHLPSVVEYGRVWKEGYGKTPPMCDDGYPSEGTIRSKFGKWRTALEQAVK